MTAPCPQLDRLPREIIAHIAGNTDAPTILSLSSINRSLRLACYDPVVFRTILKLAQTRTWPKPFVDVHAIAARAQLDVRCWARYAVAEHAAAIASQNETFRQASNILRWLPELLMVLHPDAKGCLHWIYDIRRSQNVSSSEEQLLSFCLAFVELARVEKRPRAPRAELQKFITYGRSSPTDLVVGNSMVTCHIALLQMAKAVRWDTIARRFPWPFHSDKIVLRINPPRFSAAILRLRPGAEGTLPLPLQTYHHSTTGRMHASSEWLDWYALQSQSLLRSGGTWCGYYSYGSSISDPPMVKIEFSIEESTDEGNSELRAEQCSDGYGTFSISGNVDWEGLSFRGRKRYTSSFGYGDVNGVRWLWELKLTPFGLIGDWRNDSEIARQHGQVWLWKEDWSI